MKSGHSRWLFRIAILLVLGIALLLWYTSQQGQTLLVVENRSGQPVAKLKVTVGSDTNTLKDLANGGDANAALRTGGDAHFAVKGELQDGTMISGQGRLPEGAILTILPGGQIKIRQPGKS